MPDYRIYTDGATRKNPGPSGWAAVILGNGRRVEIGGAEKYSTNNRMEMMAVIEALRHVALESDDTRITVHSDSAYVIGGITRHIKKWRLNGYIKADKTPVENRDLWEILDGLSDASVRYVKVAGHAGNRENERADEIAGKYAQRKAIRLRNEPEQTGETGSTATGGHSQTLKHSNPVAAPPVVRFPAYAVYLDGRLAAYRTWEECRAVVECARGARYKKCKTREEFEFTLEKWGVRAIS